METCRTFRVQQLNNLCSTDILPLQVSLAAGKHTNVIGKQLQGRKTADSWRDPGSPKLRQFHTKGTRSCLAGVLPLAAGPAQRPFTAYRWRHCTFPAAEASPARRRNQTAAAAATATPTTTVTTNTGPSGPAAQRPGIWGPQGGEDRLRVCGEAVKENVAETCACDACAAQRTAAAPVPFLQLRRSVERIIEEVVTSNTQHEGWPPNIFMSKPNLGITHFKRTRK